MRSWILTSLAAMALIAPEASTAPQMSVQILRPPHRGDADVINPSLVFAGDKTMIRRVEPAQCNGAAQHEVCLRKLEAKP